MPIENYLETWNFVSESGYMKEYILNLEKEFSLLAADDFTVHHRGAAPNRAGDTRLRQASLQPHHNRRAILNT